MSPLNRRPSPSMAKPLNRLVIHMSMAPEKLPVGSTVEKV